LASSHEVVARGLLNGIGRRNPGRPSPKSCTTERGPSPSSPTWCSAKSNAHGWRLRAKWGAPLGATRSGCLTEAWVNANAVTAAHV